MPSVTLSALIAVPLAGGVGAWLVGRRSPDAARWVALLAAAGISGTVGLAVSTMAALQAWSCLQRESYYRTAVASFVILFAGAMSLLRSGPADWMFATLPPVVSLLLILAALYLVAVAGIAFNRRNGLPDLEVLKNALFMLRARRVTEGRERSGL